MNDATEKVDFEITLSSTWHDHTPKFVLSLNDDIIEVGEITEKDDENKFRKIKFSRELSEGNHALKITLHSKNNYQTKVDNDGNITHDQLLHIKEIYIDEIELGHLAYVMSKFYKENETQPHEKPLNVIGYNGTYVLEFNVPSYLWFLENL
jgi:hypothetical protein